MRTARAWRRLFEPLVDASDELVAGTLAGPRPPRHPIHMARFGLSALRSASGLARSRFDGERARALFAGNAAHAMLPLEAKATASFGLILAMLGHSVGWPLPRGGSQSIADALASYLRSLGGQIETGRQVTSLGEVRGAARLVLLDVTPRQFLALAGDEAPARYRKALERYRYGPGVVKVDYALSGPVPWAAPECARAATVHLGGTLDEIAAAEAAVSKGRHPEQPYVLVAQQSLFDSTRAPEGKHTLWAYTHVPNGSTLTEGTVAAIEGQLERFAPGFRDLVLAPQRPRPGGARGPKPELRRRRHRGRQRRPTAALRPPGRPPEPVQDADRRRLPLLLVDPAGRRRPRHVRLPRRAGRAATLVAVGAWLQPGDATRPSQSCTKRILDAHTRVVLPVAQILGEHDVAAERPRRLDDRRVPVRDPEAVARLEGRPHDRRCQIGGREPQERLDERHGLLVRQPICACSTALPGRTNSCSTWTESPRSPSSRISFARCALARSSSSREIA